MKKYTSEVETQMRNLFDTLSERDKRGYVAVEAKKLGHGSQTYLAKILGCSRKTIYRGLQELEEQKKIADPNRIRRIGGGRKPFDKKR